MNYNSKLLAESWNIAIRYNTNVMNDRTTPFTVIKNPFRYWIADPFLIEKDKHYYIFAEMYDYVKARGVIGYCEIVNRKCGKWKPVIVEAYHLSYPFIFKKENDFYMIPESCGNNSLDLYKAVRFPDEWVRIRSYRTSGKYADTTIIDYKQMLAISYDTSDYHNYKLKLVDLNSDFENVLQCQDVNIVRPAGAVFEYKGQLIRPAQICSNWYGEGLCFYQVEISKDYHVSEKKIFELRPQDLILSDVKYINGIHTYNRCNEYEIIDIKTRRFNVVNLISRVIKKLSLVEQTS